MSTKTKREPLNEQLTREAPEAPRRKSEQDKRLDVYGREIPDPVPLQPPIGHKRTPPLRDQIRAMVRSEKLRAEAESAQAETFEEADDFDVGEDFDPRSPYEEVFEGVPLPPSLEKQADIFAEAMYRRFGAMQPMPEADDTPPPGGAAPGNPAAPAPPPPAPANQGGGGAAPQPSSRSFWPQPK